MKLTRIFSISIAVAGLVAFAAPADAQRRGDRGGNRGNDMNRGDRGDRNRGHFPRGRYYGGNRVGFYFGGFGYPYYGYPYSYGAPYYGGYGYGYGYPVTPYYTYDPRGVYQGRVVNPDRATNDGGGKEVSMAARVQRQLAEGGYYRGSIDGIIGDGTRRAIRSYQRDNGLAADGRIDNQLLSTMGIG
ncbi:MAG: peptidoglycan-binding protein [Chthoniobacterales bacterium]